MTARREVRVTDYFFQDLDRQLISHRLSGGTGRQVVLDLAVHAAMSAARSTVWVVRIGGWESDARRLRA